MGLELFGDLEHKMPNVTGVHIPQGVDGDRVRRALLKDFNIEIGTSFGPLHGRIWRSGTMGYNARADAGTTEEQEVVAESAAHALLRHLEAGGRRAIIGHLKRAASALAGETGTHVVHG